MTANDDRLDPQDVGYGASHDGDVEEARDQVQPDEREPASDEEVEQDNYANTDEGAS